jgi:hypothetical protein
MPFRLRAKKVISPVDYRIHERRYKQQTIENPGYIRLMGRVFFFIIDGN